MHARMLMTRRKMQRTKKQLALTAKRAKKQRKLDAKALAAPAVNEPSA